MSDYDRVYLMGTARISCYSFLNALGFTTYSKPYGLRLIGEKTYKKTCVEREIGRRGLEETEEFFDARILYPVSIPENKEREKEKYREMREEILDLLTLSPIHRS